MCNVHTYIFYYITLHLYKKDDACTYKSKNEVIQKTPRKYNMGVYAKSPVLLNNGSRESICSYIITPSDVVDS